MSYVSAGLQRADKLLSEADYRNLGEAWRERTGKVKLYTGAIAVAKCVPKSVRQQTLSAMCREGFTRLATGSQQIVVLPEADPDTVIKVDKTSLSANSLDVKSRVAEIKDMVGATQDVIGPEYMPPYVVEALPNPLKYGPASVAGILQARVYNDQDVLQMSGDELSSLADPIRDRLTTVGRRLETALRDGFQLLPELIGRNNLVMGNLSGQEPGVWLIDSLAADRSQLEVTCGPASGVTNIELYSQRVAQLVSAG